MAKQILIGDDSAFMRAMLRSVFTKAGYETAGEAESGEEVVRKFAEFRPELVTMDIVMRGDGGLRAAKEIISRDPSAKILMVSAMGQQALVIEAIQAGAKGFIVKPFEPEQLIQEVKRILEDGHSEARSAEESRSFGRPSRPQDDK